MISKKDLKTEGLVNIFLILSLSLLMCSAAFSFVLFQNRAYTNNYLDNYQRQQETLVNEVAKSAAVLINTDSTDVNSDVTEEIIKNAETSGSRYWIFLKNENVVFIQNDESTNRYKGNTIHELSEDFLKSGGSGADDFESLIRSGQSASLIFSPSNKDGAMIVSIKAFKAGSESYAIGLFTSEKYALNTGKVQRHNTYFIIFTLIFSMVFLSSTLIFSLNIYRKRLLIESRNSELQSRNSLIEQLNEKLTEKKSGNLFPDIYDPVTGVYSKEFLHSLLEKADKMNIPYVNSAVLSIVKIGEKYDRTDRSIAIDVFLKLSDIFKGVISEDILIARNSYHEFTLLIFNKPHKEAEKIVAQIVEEFNQCFKTSRKLILSAGISRQEKDAAQTVCELCDQAQKDKNLKTLLNTY